MAVQAPNGQYVGANGALYNDAGAADSSIARLSSGNKASFNVLGMLGMLAPIAMIAALALVVFLVIAALFKGLWMMLAVLPLYLVVVVLTLVVLVYLKWKRGLGFLWSLLLAGGFCALGCWGATAYYNGSSRVFPAEYSADYVLAAADGNAPALYEKRHQKGDLLSPLAVGERVTVNGVSFDYAEFNITTSGGVTGWVASEAFPTGAAEMLANAIDLDGSVTKGMPIDRQVERLMEKHLAVDGRELIIKGVPTKYYKMSAATLQRATRVGVTAPIMQGEVKAYLEGGSTEMTASGMSVRLENILYADDCTLLHLSIPPVGETGVYVLWSKPLEVKDLATGAAWRVIPAGSYGRSAWEDNASKRSNVVLFFPPFKSRRFSLTHTEPPFPDKGERSDGFVSWIASLVQMSNSTELYADWNFKEVNVR